MTMDTIDTIDQELIYAIQDGLPLVSHPYQTIATQLGLTEQQVVTRLNRLKQQGFIKRFGIVVHHKELGYKANGMVVWDIPDQQVDNIGQMLANFPYITLCYRRPRRLPLWPYNLFCMIHGKNQAQVLNYLEQLKQQENLSQFHCQILFSQRRFKQRGARFSLKKTNEMQYV